MQQCSFFSAAGELLVIMYLCGAAYAALVFGIALIKDRKSICDTLKDEEGKPDSKAKKLLICMAAYLSAVIAWPVIMWRAEVGANEGEAESR